MATNSATLTLAYADETTRKLKLDNLSESAIAPATIKPKILAINASLEGGTAGGLSTFLLSEGGANFTGIIAAQTDSDDTEYLING